MKALIREVLAVNGVFDDNIIVVSAETLTSLQAIINGSRFLEVIVICSVTKYESTKTARMRQDAF